MRFSILLLMMGLVACTSLSIKQSFTDGQMLTGRFAVSFIRDGQRYGEQGKFLWLHHPHQIQLELFSVLGQSQARLEIQDTQSILYIPGRAPQYSDDPALLLQASLGFSFPIKSLTDWLYGRPVASATAEVTRDTQGHILSIHQWGWTIDYQPFATALPPKRIHLNHTTMGLQLRLMIDI